MTPQMKQTKPKKFLECDTVEEANSVDLDTYTCLGLKPTDGRYCFKIRESKR